jgi:hypothetical protein
MKTPTPLFAILVLTLLSACQSKQQLTAQPGYSAPGTSDKKDSATSSPNSPQNPSPAAEKKASELRLQGLTFETNGSNDLLYSIEQDKEGNLILRLLRRNFTKENRELSISSAPLAEKVKTLFEGKAHYGGTLIQNGQEIDLSKDTKDAPIGDSSSKLTLNTIDEAEYLIHAPVITTEGSETLFDDLRKFIEESLNPSPKGTGSDTPTPDQSLNSCKDLKDLEGSMISVTNHEGKVSSSKGALKKIENSDQASAGSLKYEAEETREASGAKYDISVEYVYNPSSCTLSKQPYGEEKSELQVLSVKKDGTSTKIEASECKEDSCSKTDILLTPMNSAQ